MCISAIVYYHQTYDISRSLVGNNKFYHSDVHLPRSIGSRRCSNYIFILDLTLSSNRLGKDSYKMGRETFKFWDLVCLMPEVLRYLLMISHELTLTKYHFIQTKGIFAFGRKCQTFISAHLHFKSKIE